jgi:hypothetical protein
MFYTKSSVKTASTILQMRVPHLNRFFPKRILPKTGQNKQINKQTQNLIRNDPEH